MAAQSPAATPTLNKMLRTPAQNGPGPYETAGSPSIANNHINHTNHNHNSVSAAYDLKQYKDNNTVLTNGLPAPSNQSAPPNVTVGAGGLVPVYNQQQYTPQTPNWSGQQPGGSVANQNQVPNQQNGGGAQHMAMAPMTYSHSVHATTSVTQNNASARPQLQHDTLPSTSAAVQGNGFGAPNEQMTNGPARLPGPSQQQQQQQPVNGVVRHAQVQALQHPGSTGSPCAPSMSPSNSLPMAMSPSHLQAAPATPTSAPPKKSVGRPKKVKVPPQATVASAKEQSTTDGQQQAQAQPVHNMDPQSQQYPPSPYGMPPQHPQQQYYQAPGQAPPGQYQPRPAPGMYPQQGYPPQPQAQPGAPSQYAPTYGTPPRRQMSNGPSPSAHNGKNGGPPGSKDTSLPSTPGAQSPGAGSDTLDTSNSQSQWSQPPRARATPNGAVSQPASSAQQQSGTAGQGTDNVVDRLTGPIFNMPPPAYQQRRYFYEQLIRFNEAKGTPITTQPTVSKQSVDLYRLYLAVRDRGGFETVTKDKQWKDLCPVVMQEMAVSSAAGYQLRKHYTTYLLQLECQDTGRNYQELIDFAEKQKKQKKRKPTKAEQAALQAATPPAHDPAAAAVLAAGAHGYDPAQHGMQQGGPPPGWQQAPPYGHPGQMQARWTAPSHMQQQTQPQGQYPPSQATPPAYAQLAPQTRPPAPNPNSGVLVRDPFDDRSGAQVNGEQTQTGAPGAQPPSQSAPDYASATPSTSQTQAPWQQPQDRMPPGVHMQTAQPGVRMMSAGKPMPHPSHVQSWPRSSHAHVQQQPNAPTAVNRRVETAVSFPAGCVEASTVLSRKRRKIRARDVGKVDAWRLVMALRSGLHAESHWAINLLNVLLYDDSAAPFFNLRALPGLLEVLVEHLRRLLIEIFPNDGFEDLELPETPDSELTSALGDSAIINLKSETNDTSHNMDTVNNAPLRQSVRPELNLPSGSAIQTDTPPDYTLVTRTGRQVFVNEPEDCSRHKRIQLDTDTGQCAMSVPQSLVNRLQQGAVLCADNGMDSTHLCSKTWPHAYDQARLTFHPALPLTSTSEPSHPLPPMATGTDCVCPFYHRQPTEQDNSLHKNAECLTPSSCTLVNQQAHTQQLIFRCLAVSNAIRGLSFVPHNDAVMSKCSCLMAVLSRLLLLQHTHQVVKVLPTLAQTLPSVSGSQTTGSSEPSTLAGDQHSVNSLLRCADQLRDDAFVVLCQLSCTIDLGNTPSAMTECLLNALLHWSVCKAPCATDTPVPRTTSPLMYSLEILCKVSVVERNVDLLLATGPWPRLERFVCVLGELLSLGQDTPAREFALVLVQAMTSTSEAVCNVLAEHTPALHHLVAFLELHDSNMHQVVQTSGMQALRENPERMGTSVGMLRRAASVLHCLAKLPHCTLAFHRHEQRLLQFTMSQLMDSRVASIIADTLYELNKQTLKTDIDTPCHTPKHTTPMDTD